LLIDAAIHVRRGNSNAAHDALARAREVCSQSGLKNFSLYAAQRLALLQGDAEAAEGASQALASMGIRQPDRWIEAYAPGLRP
jgi:hypothetical protein